MAHPSDSQEQRSAEELILKAVSASIDVELAPRSLRLGSGARADVDGAAPDESVLVEVYAHQGRLRGAQFHKVARDALKLITLGRTRPSSRLIIAFGDSDAAACVNAKSWLAESLRAWGVEVLTVDLGEEVRAGLKSAQTRQVMSNPTLATAEEASTLT